MFQLEGLKSKQDVCGWKETRARFEMALWGEAEVERKSYLSADSKNISVVYQSFKNPCTRLPVEIDEKNRQRWKHSADQAASVEEETVLIIC